MRRFISTLFFLFSSSLSLSLLSLSEEEEEEEEEEREEEAYDDQPVPYRPNRLSGASVIPFLAFFVFFFFFFSLFSFLLLPFFFPLSLSSNTRRNFLNSSFSSASSSDTDFMVSLYAALLYSEGLLCLSGAGVVTSSIKTLCGGGGEVEEEGREREERGFKPLPFPPPPPLFV